MSPSSQITHHGAIALAPRDIARLVDDASGDGQGGGFWKSLVDHEELAADIDESGFSTTYRSYFVSDPSSARTGLETLVEKAIVYLKERGFPA